MKAFVAIAVTAVFCLSFGFFVSQNLSASSDLVALSDDEMMQQTGGKTMAGQSDRSHPSIKHFSESSFAVGSIQINPDGSSGKI